MTLCLSMQSCLLGVNFIRNFHVKLVTKFEIRFLRGILRNFNTFYLGGPYWNFSEFTFRRRSASFQDFAMLSILHYYILSGFLWKKMPLEKEILESETTLASLWLVMNKSRIREYSRCMRQNGA